MLPEKPSPQTGVPMAPARAPGPSRAPSPPDQRARPGGECQDYEIRDEPPGAADPGPHLCDSGRVRRGEPRLLPGGEGTDRAQE